MNVPAVRRFAGAVILRTVLLICLATFVPGRANAEGITGLLELGYSFSDTKAQAADGTTTRSEGWGLSQKYRLTLDRRFFPNLSLRAGGYFEKDDGTTETAGLKSESTATRISPFADLTFVNPLYTAGVGYTRREEKQESAGSESKDIRETYNASFSWKPVDFPTLDLRYFRTNTFDPGRVEVDRTGDAFMVSSRYAPARSLELTYSGNFNQNEDRIGGIVSKDTTHSGRVTYEDRFLKDRVFFHANYDISTRQTKTSASRGGEVTSPVNEVRAGLFALDDTPLEGELPGAPALVDGNLTVSSGINIGFRSTSGLQESAPRNLGLEFLRTDTRVNGLLVWVLQDPASTVTVDSVAGLFQWDVYESTNNRDWTLVQTVQSAPFGPFDKRFEVRFPSVSAQYVKVTVAPLSRSPDPTRPLSYDIFVTELQATLTLPAEEVKSESRLTSHLVNVAARTRLLDNPSLYYNFSLFYTRTDPGSLSRMLLSNGLTLTQRLERRLTANAQVAFDYVDDGERSQQNYNYGFSLNATPLRTLSHNLVYSGTYSETTAGAENGTEVRNSVFLNNRATLYQGISVFLNGGVSLRRLGTGEETRNYLMNFGSDISPHPSMTWSFGGSADRSERSGGERPDSATSSRRYRTSVSWNPLPAVNIFGSTERLVRDKTTTLHNLSLNWSPLRDGTLQMSFAANETIRPEEDGSDRLIGPTLRWQVRSGVYLDFSYSSIQSKLGAQETDSRVGATSFKAYF